MSFALSLRLRLVLAGALTILLALALATLALSALFAAHVERRAVAELSVQLDQLVAGLDQVDGLLVLAMPLADPRFARPYSGLYWQIELPTQALRSRSLWDQTISIPQNDRAAGQAMIFSAAGPQGQTLLGVARMVVLPPRLGGQSATGMLALDRAELDGARRAFVADLAPYMALLALFLIAAGWAQITVGLGPLARLRRSVADIRADASRRMGRNWPSELGPMVGELDALLDARAGDLARARLRAGDLAHGLKTPLQALMAEAVRLRQAGEPSSAADIEDIVAGMRRTLDRELARARRQHERPAGPASLALALSRVISVVQKTPDGQRLAWNCDVADDIRVPMEEGDLIEVLGAIIENAARHARSAVTVTARPSPAGLVLAIADDGAGIAEGMHAQMLTRFAKLDERGTGLGLAIASELMQASGGDIELANAQPGLRVLLTFAPGR
jgi:signal transduction histidine kinase